MNMQDISDKELDQFVKNSIEHPDLPFDEAAWEKMELSLEKHDQKQRLKSYSRRALLVLAVYILSAVSVRIVEQGMPKDSSALSADKKTKQTSITASRSQAVEEQHVTVTTETNTEAVKHSKAYNSSSSQPLSDKSIALHQDKTVKEDPRTSQRTSPAGNALTAVELRRERNESTDEEASYTYVQNKQVRVRKYNKGKSSIGVNKKQEPAHAMTSETMAQTSNNEITPTNEATLHPSVVALLAVEDQTNFTTLNPTQEVKHTTDAEPSEQTNTVNNPKTNNIDRTEQDNNLALAVDSTQNIVPVDSLLPVAAVTTKDSTLPKDKAARKRFLSFGVFAGPDFSFTASKEFVAPGLSEGFFVEYHYNTRWSLFAGLMHSSKNYSSSAADYKATDKYWGYKGYTSRIDGSCAVLDVPITIKYHYYNKDKNLLFAAAGMSSYFMLHEQYSFIYKDGSPERSWEHTKKQNYFFGLVNVSLGYERYIGKSFSVQVEPFIKIPLNNMGLGEVKLLTTGMFIYLKYSIK